LTANRNTYNAVTIEHRASRLCRKCWATVKCTDDVCNGSHKTTCDACGTVTEWWTGLACTEV
jgi:hypothetical protein